MKPHPGFSFPFCSEKTPFCSSVGGKQPARLFHNGLHKSSCFVCVCVSVWLSHDSLCSNTADVVIIRSETNWVKLWALTSSCIITSSVSITVSSPTQRQNEGKECLSTRLKWEYLSFHPKKGAWWCPSWCQRWSQALLSGADVWRRILPAVSYRLSFTSFPPTVTVVTYFSNTDAAYFCFWDTYKVFLMRIF